MDLLASGTMSIITDKNATILDCVIILTISPLRVLEKCGAIYLPYICYQYSVTFVSNHQLKGVNKRSAFVDCVGGIHEKSSFTFQVLQFCVEKVC
jgi:hypothetical protein